MHFSCAVCTREFTATKPARTCSNACRLTASRRRRRDERLVAADQLRDGLRSGDAVALAAGLGGAFAALAA